jgi:hypothetical protein
MTSDINGVNDHWGSNCSVSSAGDQQSVNTPQAARGLARPPCRHFKIQSRLSGTFPQVVGFLSLSHDTDGPSTGAAADVGLL